MSEPTEHLCREIARKEKIMYSDWVRLTGLRAPSRGESDLPFYDIDEVSGIRFRRWGTDFLRDASDDWHLQMADDNERNVGFFWGQSPAELVSFVNNEPTGALWLPDAFTEAVEEAEYSRAFDLHCELDQVTGEIEDWRRMKPTSITEKVSQLDRLTKLEERKQVIESKLAGRPAPSMPEAEMPTGENSVKSEPREVGRRVHQIDKRRAHPLNAVIEKAKEDALDPNDYHSVWAELVRLAEVEHPDRPAVLKGCSSDGIQYAGKTYQDTGVPDVFRKDALRKRMNPTAR